MRIGYLATVTTNNGLYRGLFPMSGLVRRGHEVRALRGTVKAISAELETLDVLFVHRFCDDDYQRLMRRARRLGVAVVWDDDDNVVAFRDAPPQTIRGTPYQDRTKLEWERRSRWIDRAVREADLVTTPSEHLADHFRARGAQMVTVLENYLPTSMAGSHRKQSDRLTIGWVAAREHLYDLEHVPIRGALQRIFDERHDVGVTSVGISLGLGNPSYRHVPSVPLVKLNQHGAQTAIKMTLLGEISKFDIGIAPLAASPFGLTRSNIKVKEYSAAGVPWLASPTGPYAGLGEGQGGRLVSDEGWYEALSRLLDKARERRKLAKNAIRWAASQTVEQNAYRWEEAFQQAVAQRGGRGGPV